MIVFCHDCEHWFVEHAVDTEADLMACPYCDGGNFDTYSEEE